MEFSPFGRFLPMTRPPSSPGGRPFFCPRRDVAERSPVLVGELMSQTPAFRSAVRLVALLNLAYFGVEMVVALRIGSVSLLADSADFFEDAAVNFLIFAALGWSVSRRGQVGRLLAAILLARP